MTETETAIVVLLSMSFTRTRRRRSKSRRKERTYFEELSPSASPLDSPLPPTLPLLVVCGTTFGTPVVCTLPRPSVAVTIREEGVSVNCEFTLICESEPGADKEADESDEDVDESDEGVVDAEPVSEMGVGTEEEEVEEEIAEAEVMVDEEEMEELLSTDDAAEEEEDKAEEEGAPAPAGGNLSSAPPLSSQDFRTRRRLTNPQSTQNNQHPDKCISDTARCFCCSHWRFSMYVQNLPGPW